VKIGVPVQPVRKAEDLAPISLVDEAAPGPGGAAASPTSRIRAFGPAGGVVAHAFKRQPFMTGHGAIRVRTFHGRLSEEGMGFLDEKVNEWVDQHPEIDIKLVTTTIGTFEGKIREPALVVNVWY
jgi:hypothetical protein